MECERLPILNYRLVAHSMLYTYSILGFKTEVDLCRAEMIHVKSTLYDGCIHRIILNLYTSCTAGEFEHEPGFTLCINMNRLILVQPKNALLRVFDSAYIASTFDWELCIGKTKKKGKRYRHISKSSTMP